MTVGIVDQKRKGTQIEVRRDLLSQVSFFGFRGGSGILQRDTRLAELSDYACSWSLLRGGPGRSWAVSDTLDTSRVKHTDERERRRQ